MNRATLHLLRAIDPSLPTNERREAFGQVVGAYQDAAFAIAFAVLADSQAAQDAALEGFVDAWRSLSSLRDPDAFAGWLRSLVRTRALRHVRATVTRAISIEEVPEIGELQDSVGAEQRIVVRHAIEGLPKKEREALVLFYVAGLTREEVASFVVASPVSVNKRLARALARLREESIYMENNEFKNDVPSINDDFRRKALVLSGQFAELLASKKPILLALDDCIAEAGTGAVRTAFEDMQKQVVQGKAMAEAMRRHQSVFDEADTSAVFYGEEMGLLHDILRRIAKGERFETRESLIRAFSQA